MEKAVVGIGCAAIGAWLVYLNWARGRTIPLLRPDVNVYYTNGTGAVFFKPMMESKDRELYVKRDDIIAAIPFRRGMTVCDFGSGTGAFLPGIVKAIGPEGRILAVEYSTPLLDDLQARLHEFSDVKGQIQLVKPLDSFTLPLPPNSVDLLYVCDAYHHIAYPKRVLQSFAEILKPGGYLIVIDFEKIPGVTLEVYMNHVRLDKPEVIQEIRRSRQFELEKEVSGILKDNYILMFRKKLSV